LDQFTHGIRDRRLKSTLTLLECETERRRGLTVTWSKAISPITDGRRTAMTAVAHCGEWNIFTLLW